MADRPWVTPEEVREYTDYPKVQTRSDNKLVIDISRAELYVIAYTRNRFEDYAQIPAPVKNAVILVAEMYAQNAAEAKGAYKSETYDDYSYTLADTGAKLDNLLLAPLLDEYVLAENRNAVTMRLRKL